MTPPLDHYCRDCHHMTESVEGKCKWCRSVHIESGVEKFKAKAQWLGDNPKAAEAQLDTQPKPQPIEDTRRGSSITLEFCRWLHDNFDLLISEAEKEEMIQQAHADAAAEVALGSPEERKHKVFAAGVGGEE